MWVGVTATGIDAHVSGQAHSIPVDARLRSFLPRCLLSARVTTMEVDADSAGAAPPVSPPEHAPPLATAPNASRTMNVVVGGAAGAKHVAAQLTGVPPAVTACDDRKRPLTPPPAEPEPKKPCRENGDVVDVDEQSSCSEPDEHIPIAVRRARRPAAVLPPTPDVPEATPDEPPTTPQTKRNCDTLKTEESKPKKSPLPPVPVPEAPVPQGRTTRLRKEARAEPEEPPRRQTRQRKEVAEDLGHWYTAFDEEDPAEVAARAEVTRVLKAYTTAREEFIELEAARVRKKGGTMRPDLMASKELRERGDCMYTTKRPGALPGIRPGQAFLSRAELTVHPAPLGCRSFLWGQGFFFLT